MSVLPELETQLRGAARRTQPKRRRLRAWPLASVAVLLSGASLAGAAVQLIGAPTPKTAPTGTRHAGPGLTLPSSVRLLDVRAADPDGGAPWGIRVQRTSRTAACWQVGRIVSGKLGVIDAGGRFHETPVQQEQCRPLDGHERLFAYQEVLALPGGQMEPWTCAPGCARGTVRFVRFGFLGPEAVAAGPQGAPARPVSHDGYAAVLFVERADAERPVAHPPLVATYRDGSRRAVDDFVADDPGTGGAPPPGLTPLATTLPVHVRSPLRLSGTRRGKDTIYTLRFRAPVSTRRYGVRYRVVITAPRSGRGCDEPMDFGGFDTPGDVRAGQRITIKLTPGIQLRYGHGWCRGRYRGSVILHDTAHVVGRFSFVAR